MFVTVLYTQKYCDSEPDAKNHLTVVVNTLSLLFQQIVHVWDQLTFAWDNHNPWWSSPGIFHYALI